VELADRYDELRRAFDGGDDARASALFHEIVGLVPRAPREPGEPPLPVGPTPQRTALLRHDQPRAIDVRALRAGARDIAKFEDLGLDAALRLEKRLRAEGFTVVRSAPYARRYDVSLTVGGAPTRFDVVASRGDLAERFVEAERDRSYAGTRRAGELLGYPACCIEHFIALERRAASEHEGVNEVALRAFADGADVTNDTNGANGSERERGVGAAGMIPWELNPLSQHAPVGFAACSARCTAALAFARRLLAVLPAEELALVRRVLSRPLLVMRLPLFWALDGVPTSPLTGPLTVGRAAHEVRYDVVAVHDHGSHPALQAWGARTLGVALAAGNVVRLDERSLSITRSGERAGTWTWALTAPRVPRLLCFE
jgi:hypothetical protein